MKAFVIGFVVVLTLFLVYANWVTDKGAQIEIGLL
jgi:hypothetical protein